MILFPLTTGVLRVNCWKCSEDTLTYPQAHNFIVVKTGWLSGFDGMSLPEATIGYNWSRISELKDHAIN